MRLLILGGTRFVGRHLVEAARRDGHEVTLFNRGTSAPGLFPGVETLVGDRDGDHAALTRGTWDAVVVDIETGRERGRVDTGCLLSGGMWYTPGLDRDLYTSSAYGGIARVFATR